LKYIVENGIANTIYLVDIHRRLFPRSF